MKKILMIGVVTLMSGSVFAISSDGIRQCNSTRIGSACGGGGTTVQCDTCYNGLGGCGCSHKNIDGITTVKDILKSSKFNLKTR